MLDTLAERERLTGLAYAGGWTALALSAAGCLWVASELFWQFMPKEPVVALERSASAPVADAATGEGVALESLHLFGQAGVAVTPALIDAPETTLDLKLLGTLASDDPSEGLAIIVDGEGRESYYGVGDDLPGSARLHEIHADRVLLVRAGQYETLSLREQGEGLIQGGSRRGTTGTRQAARPGPAAGPAIPGIRGGLDFRAVQNQYRIDPAQLAQKIQVQPMTENGQPIGVRLQAGRDAALMRILSQAGLRSTDIITSVNGIPLNDPTRAFEAVSQLQNETSFTVVVRRDGRDQTLNIDLNQ